ncbi:peptidylprolyl isomerase [Gemmatimonas sp.]|uniref:peptidylprolyl isomerase n=1 Tax=Gemmatimonas sp. TaxID=1962908 RepID=UPI00286CBD14|nr:peptidylprolyl isomerase [Gemmatimonas sp.]
MSVRTTRILLAIGLTAMAACSAEPRAPAQKSAPRVIPGPAATPMRSPDVYRVRFETSKGPFAIEVTRALSPRGADRFYELVTIGYYAGNRFFRMVPGFVVQFGIHGDPAVNAKWAQAAMADEPMRQSNTRGTVAFTTVDANSRTVQLFVNMADNAAKLDRQRVFAPIGVVVDGMDVLERLNVEYGEDPVQSRIMSRGNKYLDRWFPALDSIVSATVVPTPSVPAQ